MHWGRSRRISQEIKAASAFRMCLHTEAFSLASQPHLIAEVPRKKSKYQIHIPCGLCRAGGETHTSMLNGPTESHPTTSILVVTQPSLSSSIIFSCEYPFILFWSTLFRCHLQILQMPECFQCLAKDKTCLKGNWVFSNSWQEDLFTPVPNPKGPGGRAGFPVS